ncbi:RimJ/RimL family protein N-acetyltransferase [Lewinellaceae bacterium SD302]|nr:RimJ/RimL family protein N-acetyltransferase [Lewinellaceae bacterium SD302]
MKIFSTERLTLSRFKLTDGAFILELLNSPGWLEYIGDRQVKTVEDAEHYLSSKMLPAYAKDGMAGWKVTLNITGKPIGSCGFYQRDYLDSPDLGFAFLPEYIGQGYGFEAAKGCLDYAVENMGLQKCCAITIPENKASIGLLEKLGFVMKDRTRDPDTGADLLIFEWSI